MILLMFTVACVIFHLTKAFFCYGHMHVTTVANTNVIAFYNEWHIYQDHQYTCLQRYGQVTASSSHAQLNCHKILVIYYSPPMVRTSVTSLSLLNLDKVFRQPIEIVCNGYNKT